MAHKGDASDIKLAKMIIDSAQDIWLAGLSAFERAGQEGGEFFDHLVEEGRQVEARMRQSADSTFEEVKRSASGNWNTLERVFEDRVARALQQLGIPTREDILALNRQVAHLDQQISELLGKTAEQSDSHDTQGDDLKQINGIGAAIEKKLHAHGITTFEQIAAWSDVDIEQIEENILAGRFAGRIRKDDWISQARKLHQKKPGEDA